MLSHVISTWSISASATRFRFGMRVQQLMCVSVASRWTFSSVVIWCVPTHCHMRLRAGMPLMWITNLWSRAFFYVKHEKSDPLLLL